MAALVDQKLYSVPEAAALLGVAARTLDDWRQDGRGPRFLVCGYRRVKYAAEDLEMWLQSLRRQSYEGSIDRPQRPGTRRRNMALPLQFPGQGTQRSDRFGRHISNRKAAEEFARAKREALKHARPGALLTAAKKARPVVLGGEVAFIDAAKEFTTWCKDTEYRARPSTAERIRVSFATINDFFGATPVRLLNSEAVEMYKAHRITDHGVRDITVRHDLHALSLFFQFARRRGWTKADPMDGVTIPSDRDAIREHVITPEEEERYFAAAARLHAQYKKSFPKAQPNLADVARLMLEQGPRPEELLAACQEHVGDGTLRIAGGKSRAARRTLHLTAASEEILKRRLDLPGPWLFPSDRNPGHHMTKLDGTHDRVCIEAGVSFVLYDFRHTFATRAIEDGVPVAVVAAILGHSGLRTIHRYVHPSSDAQKRGMATYQAAIEQRKKKVG